MVCRSWSCNNKNMGQFWRKDPRKENVEISVRPYCFWPEKPLNYITVSGFTLRQDRVGTACLSGRFDWTSLEQGMDY